MSFFSVPASYISIDIFALFSTAIFVALYVFFLFIWLSVAFDYSKSKSNVTKAVGKLMIYFGFFPVIYFFSEGTENLIYVMYVLVGIGVLTIILEKIEKKITFLSKASFEIHKAIDESATATLKSKTAFSALQEAGAMFILLLLPFALAFFAGSNNAKENSSFEIIASKKYKELAVIRNYGQQLIAVPFNREHKSIEKKYIIINLSSVKSMDFTPEDIGPLTKNRLKENEIKKK